MKHLHTILALWFKSFIVLRTKYIKKTQSLYETLKKSNKKILCIVRYNPAGGAVGSHKGAVVTFGKKLCNQFRSMEK